MRNSPLQSEPARSAALALTVACLLTDHLRRSRSWRDLPAFSPPLSRLFLGPATMLRAVLLALLAGLLPLASAFAVAPTGALAACRAAPADITSTPPTWDALTPHGPPPAVFFSLRASPKKLEALRLTHQATRARRARPGISAPCSYAHRAHARPSRNLSCCGWWRSASLAGSGSPRAEEGDARAQRLPPAQDAPVGHLPQTAGVPGEARHPVVHQARWPVEGRQQQRVDERPYAATTRGLRRRPYVNGTRAVCARARVPPPPCPQSGGARQHPHAARGSRWAWSAPLRRVGGTGCVPALVAYTIHRRRLAPPRPLLNVSFCENMCRELLARRRHSACLPP